MSLKVEDMDMENLSDDEKQYLRDRPWLPQPPGDPAYVKPPQDWNEDDHETVGVDGAADDGEENEEPSTEGAFDDDGDPIKLNDDGDFAGYDWGRMTNPRLREFCEAYELPVSGNKSDLVARLEEYDDLTSAGE
jgi:hypothetical protein